jgi:hypothetical protein
MTHLHASNASYGQKKGHESNCQFVFRPVKVGNHPNFVACRWSVTYRCKALNEGYKFALDLILTGGFHAKLWAPKVVEVPTLICWSLHFPLPTPLKHLQYTFDGSSHIDRQRIKNNHKNDYLKGTSTWKRMSIHFSNWQSFIETKIYLNSYKVMPCKVTNLFLKCDM